MILQGELSAFIGDGIHLLVTEIYIFLLYFTLAILLIYLFSMVDTQLCPKAKPSVVNHRIAWNSRDVTSFFQ